MAAPQSTGSTPTRTAPRTTLGRALMWPAVAAGLGMVLIYNSFGTSVDDKPPALPAAVSSAAPEVLGSHAAPAPVTSSKATVGPAMSRSVPKRLRIPAIAVDAPFTDLSIGATGRLDAPPPNDRNLVGWFKDGATPGERGAAIVAGHVDTMTGPAVFLQLRFLGPGSQVDITRADGSVATFKVDSVEQFSKAKFPDDRVYADTNSAELRLITCGGAYNKTAKDYEDNVVVFAHLDTFKKG
ncbi:class F sortase [Streptomyces sp. NBC_01363]|uniref:class F sortase n=1 Tax=Streptomyces sp. NBC_01363 TaxID=2903840 RepID=UPI0022564C1E|nr:class F sortase [Streptomyces sp. NBC_01363]MCX4729695.1 class F sortase [Streptomyces sp. NBC_01363]